MAGGDLGTALGLSAVSDDRVGQLLSMGENQAKFVAAARERQRQYQQKLKDNQLAKSQILVDKIDFNKFPVQLQGAAQQKAHEATADLYSAYYDNRTDAEMGKSMSDVLVNLNKNLATIEQNGQNYKFNAAVPVDKTDFWGARMALASQPMDKEKTDAILHPDLPANPFGSVYDPTTGAMGKAYVDKKPENWGTLFNNQVGKGKSYVNEVGKKFNLADNVIQEINGHLLETEAEAQDYAKAHNLGFVPASAESLAQQFVKENNYAPESWLHGQFTPDKSPDEIKALTQKYFTVVPSADGGTQFIPKTDVIQKDFQQFVKDGLKDAAGTTYKYENGRFNSTGTGQETKAITSDYNSAIGLYKQKQGQIEGEYNKAQQQAASAINNDESPNQYNSRAEKLKGTMKDKEAQASILTYNHGLFVEGKITPDEMNQDISDFEAGLPIERRGTARKDKPEDKSQYDQYFKTHK